MTTTLAVSASPVVPLVAVDDVGLDPETGAITAHKLVRADEPYLAGHYPGDPIYPGVFTVESVVQAVRVATGRPGLTVRSVASLRLLDAVRPGDVLTVVATTTVVPDGLRVSARCETAPGRAAARATLLLDDGMATSLGAAPDSPPSAAPTAPVAVPALPHRYPILLVDAVTELAPGERIVATTAISRRDPCYADNIPGHGDDRFPATLLLESFVQAGAALWLGSSERADGTLVLGSVRDAVLGEVRPGELVSHHVSLERVAAGVGVLTGYSLSAGRLVAVVGSAAVAART